MPIAGLPPLLVSSAAPLGFGHRHSCHGIVFLNTNESVINVNDASPNLAPEAVAPSQGARPPAFRSFPHLQERRVLISPAANERRTALAAESYASDKKCPCLCVKGCRIAPIRP